MQITDAIGDMLTRIRNASSVKHETVSVPASNMKKEIARILQDEGYISSYKVIEDNKQGVIEIKLKYNQDRTPAIMGIKRVSKPGLRIYADVDNLPRVIRGMGIAILSTSKGVMTDKEARRSNVGGEVIAYVW
jgi:small subunit ribosomal protein S8